MRKQEKQELRHFERRVKTRKARAQDISRDRATRKNSKVMTKLLKHVARITSEEGTTRGTYTNVHTSATEN